MKRLGTLLAVGLAIVSIQTNAAEDRKDRRAVRERGDRQEARHDKQDVEERIRQINKLDNRPAVRDAGLRAVSKELGKPVPQLEAQLKEHSNLGIAGLLVANTIASESRKEPANVIKAHGNGTSWVEMARNNNVSLDTIEAKLARVETAMRDAK